VNQPASPADHESVTAFLDQIRRAWDDGDATAYAALFAENASYVIFLGDALFGRDQIAQTHHDVFTKWQKGTKMAVRALDVRLLGADAAVVTTVGGIGRKAEIPYDKFQTYTLRRVGPGWECVAFQNTEMSRRAKRLYAN
jgi:uncharacterized protein (TIGR02246 family)